MADAMRSTLAAVMLAALLPVHTNAQGGFFGGLSDGLSDGSIGGGINCKAAPANDVALLVKQINEHERGIRELHLPKETSDRLIRDGREILIKNHALQDRINEIKIAEACTREHQQVERNRQGRQLRNLQEQNSEILERQDKIMRQNRDIQDEIDRRKLR